MAAPVTWSDGELSDKIGAFWPFYERIARRFTGVKGAEFDDLVQEAAIAGWLAIEAGFMPTVLICERACMRYCRSLHTGGWRLVAES